MARKNIDARKPAMPRQTAELRVKAAEVGELRLVDKAGRIRAALEVTRTGPRLAMLHEDGTLALEVVLAPNGPSIRLAGADGQTRVFIGATRDAARIGLADDDGAQRVFLGVSAGGKPAVTIYDPDQRTLWGAP